eukprot:1670828-Rhodomonas_salina.1
MQHMGVRVGGGERALALLQVVQRERKAGTTARARYPPTICSYATILRVSSILSRRHYPHVPLSSRAHAAAATRPLSSDISRRCRAELTV